MNTIPRKKIQYSIKCMHYISVCIRNETELLAYFLKLWSWEILKKDLPLSRQVEYFWIRHFCSCFFNHIDLDLLFVLWFCIPIIKYDNSLQNMEVIQICFHWFIWKRLIFFPLQHSNILRIPISHYCWLF